MSFPLYIFNHIQKNRAKKPALAQLERGELEGKKKSSFCLQLWHAYKSVFRVAGAAVLVYTVLLYLLLLISTVCG